MSISYSVPDQSGLFEIKTTAFQTHSCRKHVHREPSIGIVDGGQTMVVMQGQAFSLSARQVIVIPALVPHACTPVSPETWQSTMIHFGRKYRNPWLEHRLGSGTTTVDLSGDAHEEISKSVRQVLLCNDGEANRRIMDRILAIMEKESLPASGPGRAESGPAQKIRTYVEAHYLESLSLEHLSRVFGLDKYALLKAFRKEYSITPVAYRTCLRLDLAKRLLGKGMRVPEAALEAGFCDQAHLTREFRKTYGVTPGAYRDMRHSGNFVQDETCTAGTLLPRRYSREMCHHSGSGSA